MKPAQTELSFGKLDRARCERERLRGDYAGTDSTARRFRSSGLDRQRWMVWS